MVDERRSEDPLQWACIVSIAEKLGMTPETLRTWVRKAENAEEPTKGNLAASERMKRIEHESGEFRRSNEIVKAAAAFFGARLDY